MGKLSAFLRPAPAGRTKEVFLDRFTDEKGNVVPIIVKCVTPEENKKISQKCTREDGTLDTGAYGDQMIVECMVEPDLRNTELCEYYGTMDPGDVPNRMFTIGEKQIIQDAIMEVNDITMADERLRKAKNS